MTPEESGLSHCASAQRELEGSLVFGALEGDRQKHVRTALEHIREAQRDLHLLQVEQENLRNSVLNMINFAGRNYE